MVLKFDIFDAIPKNKYRWRDTSHAKEVLGWQLNVRTTNHSAVRVQILDGDTGEPLLGYTWDEAISISGNHHFARPMWQEHQDLSKLVGKPMRIVSADARGGIVCHSHSLSA